MQPTTNKRRTRKYETTITESAKEIIQLQEKSTKNEWWNEMCRQAI